MNIIQKLPYIFASERSSLVDQLLDCVKSRDDYIKHLEGEIKRLKNLPQKPALSPSKLKQGNKSPQVGVKRPGSDKAHKTEKLVIHETRVLSLKNLPVGARFKGYRHFTVQDIAFNTINTLFKCARYRLSDGKYIQARLPAGYADEHFGPTLRTYILHQYHHQGVTQPLLLKQLREWNISISKGQLTHLLTTKNAVFHAEKENIFHSGVFLSAYLQTDDTGARHQGRNGYCNYVGNELFAYFNSSKTKNRLNFIECLQGKAKGFKLDARMIDYLKSTKIALNLKDLLDNFLDFPRYFTSKELLSVFLKNLGIDQDHELKRCIEAAAFSYLRDQSLSKNIILMSDEAGQFQLPEIKHALCWVHVERKLKQLMPHTPENERLLNKKAADFWQLYQDLQHYKKYPDKQLRLLAEKKFSELCEPTHRYHLLDAALARIKKWQQKLLLVLDYPFIPLHNNGSESDIREYVRRRKISGGTRSELGRTARDTFASIKKTCMKLGIHFWDYLQDQICKTSKLRSLVEYMYQKASKDTHQINFALNSF